MSVLKLQNFDSRETVKSDNFGESLHVDVNQIWFPFGCMFEMDRRILNLINFVLARILTFMKQSKMSRFQSNLSNLFSLAAYFSNGRIFDKF